MGHNFKKLIIESTKLDTNKNPYYTYISLEEEYDQKGNVRSTTVFDNDGDIESKQIYTLTDEGLIKEVVNYEKGDLIERTEIIEDFNGEVEKEITTYSDGSKHIKTYSYNDVGKVLSAKIVDEDGGLYKKEVYHYDELGREIENIFYNEDEEVDESNKYEYLGDTELINKHIVSNYLTEDFSTIITNYNQHNLEEEQLTYSQDNKLIEKYTSTYKGELLVQSIGRNYLNSINLVYDYEYDRNNNFIKETHRKNNQVIYYAERKYNNDNFLLEEEEFRVGSYAEPATFFNHKFIYEYWD